jgi:hypothetical protein
MESSKNGTGLIFKILQILVPILLFVLGVYIRQVDTNIDNVRKDIVSVKTDIKTNYDLLFKHMTNDEMHAPRSMVLTRPEFAIYQSFRDKQMTDLTNMQIQMTRDMKEGFDKIYKSLERHIEQTLTLNK